MSKTFSREELAAAFATFENAVDRAATTKDWDVWVEHYTPDVEYVEHAAGTMKGREEARSWIWKTMTSFPGSYMTGFPALWFVSASMKWCRKAAELGTLPDEAAQWMQRMEKMGRQA